MIEKKPKNYRLSEDIISKLVELQAVSGKNATELIENSIKYVHGEYIRKKNGKEFEPVVISQVVGIEV